MQAAGGAVSRVLPAGGEGSGANNMSINDDKGKHDGKESGAVRHGCLAAWDVQITEGNNFYLDEACGSSATGAGNEVDEARSRSAERHRRL